MSEFLPKNRNPWESIALIVNNFVKKFVSSLEHLNPILEPVMTVGRFGTGAGGRKNFTWIG